MNTKQAVKFKFSAMFILTFILFTLTDVQANDGLLEGVPYIASSTSSDAEAPYLICLSEHLFQIEAGTWEDRKSKTKKEGNLIYFKKQGKLLEFFREEKKIRINQNDKMVFKLNSISSNQFEEIFLGIKDEKDATEPSYLLYHYKPRNVMILNYFSGGSLLGFNFMTATSGNFMCKPMLVNK